jgi:hypothetical protein
MSGWAVIDLVPGLSKSWTNRFELHHYRINTEACEGNGTTQNQMDRLDLSDDTVMPMSE